MTTQSSNAGKNLFLIAGIGLPFALMLFVVLYQQIVKQTVPDPQYAAVYATKDDYYYNTPMRVAINNNHLEATIDLTPPANSNITPLTPTQIVNYKTKVYVWHPSKLNPEMYELHLTDAQAQEKSLIKLNLPPPLQVPMITGPTAPDGYQFIPYNYDDFDGLIPALMVGSNNHHRYNQLVKNGRHVPLPGHDQRSYWNVEFLGWIAEPVHP